MISVLPSQPNQSIIDGFRCLQHVVTEEKPVGVTELAAGLGLEVTRVHRLLRTLSHLGMIVQTEGRKYGPGPAISILAAQTLHATRFGERALPELERLARATRKKVAFGVLWERSVSYLYHGGGPRGWHQAIGGHELWPATKSGLGIAILATLSDQELKARFGRDPIPGFKDLRALQAVMEKTRRQGYAFISTEGSQATLAVALENSPSLAVGMTGRLKSPQLAGLLPKLQAAARVIDAGFSLFRVRS